MSTSKASVTPIPILFGLPRFATTFYYSALITLTLPKIIQEAVGDQQKGLHLGSVMGLASLVSILLLYILGHLSDVYIQRSDRKRYQTCSLFLSLPPLLVFALGAGYPILVLSAITLICARSLSDASHLSILADQVDFEKKERFSTYISFYHFLGSGLGTLAFGYLPQTYEPLDISFHSTPAAISTAVILLVIAGFHFSYRPVSFLKEKVEPIPIDRPRLIIPPNLMNLIAARLFFLAGILVIMTFLVFMVRDLLEAKDVKQTTALLYTGALVGALIFSFPAGRICEKTGERSMLLFVGVWLAVVPVVFIIFGRTYMFVAMICMVIFGGGFAAMITSGISLITKLVPNPEVSGRIMAIVTASSFISQFLASISGALLLDPFNRLGKNYGYYALLAIIEIFFLFGGVFLIRIDSTTTKNT